jgi:hypothetical protein
MGAVSWRLVRSIGKNHDTIRESFIIEIQITGGNKRACMDKAEFT